MTAAELWERLSARGLVEGEAPPERPPQSFWYVRVMLGIAGWIGGAFLIGFVAAAFSLLVSGQGIPVVLGAACCAGAYALFRAFDGQAFAEQFALALSLAGQGLVVMGLFQLMGERGPAPYLAVAAVEAGLVLAVPNFLHRVLAAGGAAVAVALALAQLSLQALSIPLLCAGMALAWLEPRRWARQGRLWRPVGYGLVLALLLVETFRLFGAAGFLFGWRESASDGHGDYQALAGRGMSAALLVCVAALLSLGDKPRRASSSSASAIGAALLLGLISLKAPGLASALLVLLLGFAAANRLLMALGILSLLGFVTHFYYSLHATLLAKSGLLAATGLCLLAAHMVIRRLPAEGGDASHA